MKILPKTKNNYVLFPLTKKDGTLLDGVIEITDAELKGLKAKTHCFNDSLTAVILSEPKPKAESKVNREAELRRTLRELSEDFLQAEAGAVIPDLADRKSQFRAAHNELRQIKGLPPRQYEEG